MGPIWGKPDGSQMGPTVQMEYGYHMGHLGPNAGPHVCPSGSHMGSPYGNHMVGEFCPDGNQMGPIFFATWD